jgi:hypothetical protein
MYHVLLSEQEIAYLQDIVVQKLNNYSGHESKVLESIKKKLEDPENADEYYDGPEY